MMIKTTKRRLDEAGHSPKNRLFFRLLGIFQREGYFSNTPNNL